MRQDCALYRCEKHREDGLTWIIEYCDGLDDPFCRAGKSCPFYKWRGKWKAVVVRKMTQYVRAEE